MTLHHVFVSYTRSDAAIMEEVAALLERSHVPLWIDRRDIPVTVPWLEDIRHAISRADVVAVLASSAYFRSEVCQLELRVAEGYAKRIVRIDLPDTAPYDAAARIAAAHRATTAAESFRTELLTRSAAWEQAGRPASQLARGRVRRRLRRATRASEHRLTEVEQAFQRASRRRDRRRRAFRLLGASILLIAFGLSKAGEALEKLGNQRFTKTAHLLATQKAASTLLDADVYGALSRATGTVARAPEGFVGRDQLMRALSTPVPDRSLVAHGAPVRFAPGDSGARPVVLDAGRRRVPLVPSAGAAESAAGERSMTTASPVVARRGGLRAVAQGRDGVVQVRSARGRLLRTVVVDSAPGALAFSPDARSLAVGVGDEVQLVDLARGAVGATLRGSIGRVRALSWSVDGTRIWAIAGDRRVTGWRWRAGTRMLDDRSAWLIGLSGPDEHGRVVTAARDGRAWLIDGRARVVLAGWRTGAREATALSSDPAMRRLALSDGKGLLIVDVASRRERRARLGGCPPAGTAFSPDGAKLYVACLDNRLVSVDPLDGRVVAQMPVRADGGSALSLAVARDTGQIFIGTAGGGVVTVDPATLMAKRIGGACGVRLFAVATSRNGRRLRVAGDGAGFPNCVLTAVADGSGWHWFNTIVSHLSTEQSRAAAYRPDGEVVAAGYGDGTVSLQTSVDLTPIWTWNDIVGSVRGLVFTRDGRSVIAASREGVVEKLPACPGGCETARSLIELARARLRRAERLGLTSR